MLQKHRRVKIIYTSWEMMEPLRKIIIMMFNSQGLKETVGQISPQPAKSLRIGSWNVRTMYEAEKTAQIVKEMHRYRLHMLEISETHWNQSAQKTLSTGELLTFSGNVKERPHREGVGIILDKSTQKTTKMMGSIRTKSYSDILDN
ncbi:craniofacial development protein 2-like [Elysia marginata]|uniref:Craniofacial development protein 2-like n=1 Tax=Elysia marginata TaxID=1093978 RepID=A0AAV4ER62_9GAST|nr:craniofacial development protein 2-like [Elysia marginata]